MFIATLFLIQISASNEGIGLVRKTWKEDGHLMGSYCGATLVAPQTILTAAQCLKSETDCENATAIFWNEIDGKIDPFESRMPLKCRRILQIDADSSQVLFETSDSTKDLEVVAIPKTQKTNFNETDALKVVQRDHLKGDSKSTDCRIEKKLVTNSSKNSETIYLTNCTTMNFEPGTPILSESNELLGIVWGVPKDNASKSYLIPVSKSLYQRLQDTRDK